LLAFEWIIGLLLGAVALSALARRLNVPYPTFLAIGGMLLAFVPGAPSWTLEPELALALFVAPVLLDAAFDTSLRDLRNNWLPVSTLVLVAVGITTATVAVVAHWLRPDMPWAVAIALGAIVAPPDAAAATAILRQVNLPYRIQKILEGESLRRSPGHKGQQHAADREKCRIGYLEPPRQRGQQHRAKQQADDPFEC
jgi:monovalent cation/hydrogen antiporter